MFKALLKICVISIFALLLASTLAVSPLTTVTSYASSARTQATWTGRTTDWANVRTGPTTGASIHHTAAPGTTVTVSATVSGQTVWGGISSWYQVGTNQYIYSPLVTQVSGSSTNQPPASTGSNTSTSKTGTTTGWANVRSGAGTGYALLDTYAPGRSVTLYQSVSGQIVWGGISTWYRISSSTSNPLYIYGGLIAVSSGNTNTGGSNPNPPTAQGKIIVVNLSKQWLYAYENGKQVYQSAVTTGRPELPTPTGTYHILNKAQHVWFYSPWPPGSPYYYAPVETNYAMQWRADGYYLHDAPWRGSYGPGTNNWHQDSLMGWTTGSHGCINLPLAAEAWVYNWAPVGTTVQVNP